MKSLFLVLIMICFTCISSPRYVMASEGLHKGYIGNDIGESPEERLQLVAIGYSEPKPQQGQKHRSGNNFTFRMPDNVAGIIWKVTSVYDPVTHIRFDIKYDRTLAIDPTLFSYISHETFTRVPRQGNSNRYYIANPVGATGNFKIEVYAYIYDQY